MNDDRLEESDFSEIVITLKKNEVVRQGVDNGDGLLEYCLDHEIFATTSKNVNYGANVSATIKGHCYAKCNSTTDGTFELVNNPFDENYNNSVIRQYSHQIAGPYKLIDKNTLSLGRFDLLGGDYDEYYSFTFTKQK